MMEPTLQGGASLQARIRIPSIDLASLLECLADAFPTAAASGGSACSPYCASQPVLRYNRKTGRLILDTDGILRRFLASPKLRQRFRQSETGGFLRDLVPPPKPAGARLGGKLHADDFAGVKLQLARLQQHFTDACERLRIPPESLLPDDPEAVLSRLIQTTQAPDFLKEYPARLVAASFSGSTSSKGSKRDFARLFSAREQIQAEDWLERMAAGMAALQKRRDPEFDEIQRDKLFETLRQDAERGDSQITRFLHFLEDEALARLRLSVGMTLMHGLAEQKGRADDQASEPFRKYVGRVHHLFCLYGCPESGAALELDLSRDYGSEARFVWSEELVKAGFYQCLPVWTEWNAQIFESRSRHAQTGAEAVVREVSYRFRINGRVPGSAAPTAFATRLAGLRRLLLERPEAATPFQLRRALAETLFLWLVLHPKLAKSAIYADFGEDADFACLEDEEFETLADGLAEYLQRQGRAGVAVLLDELDGWGERVGWIAKGLVDRLRERSEYALKRTREEVQSLYLVVQEGVVDWAALGRSGGKVQGPLVKPATGRSETAEWLRHVKIASRPGQVPANLFSLRVDIRLHARTLTETPEDDVWLRLRREVPEDLLNIAWFPIRLDRASNPPRLCPRLEQEWVDLWRMGPGVDLWYDPELFRRRQRPGAPGEEDAHQYRAAAVAALAVLVQVFLHGVLERLRGAGHERLTALMLRLQTEGRQAADGHSLVYAAAHAVEIAMMREVPMRMQGLVVEEGEDQASADFRFRKRGCAYALGAALPLLLELPSAPALERAAVLVYSTRPCDRHPQFRDADGYLFQAKTYVAEAVTEPCSGYRMAFERMQTLVVASSDEFASPRLIVEEIARLYRAGYRHVFLISSHYGSRRLNRTAERHAPHVRLAFLEEVAAKFPEVNVYTLRRDVFPATRLHGRRKDESAFEASRLADHNRFAPHVGESLLKQMIPAYTLATLFVPCLDDDARPQSGFCTYFFDADYQLSRIEWQERVRGNLLGAQEEPRRSLLAVLRGLHYLEAEKPPEGGQVKAVLDPFGWMRPECREAAGEIVAIPASRRRGEVVLSLPALLSHVGDALHSGAR